MAAQEQEPSSPVEKQQLPTPPPEREDDLRNDDVEESKPKESTASTGTTSSSNSTEPSKESPVVTSQDKAESGENPSAEKSPKEKQKAETSEGSKHSGTDKKDDQKTENESKPDTEDKKSKEKKDEKKEDKKDEPKALPRGMKADAKTLWAKSDAQCKCCTTWVEDNPDDGKDVEQSDKTLQHAIVVRKKKKHEGNRKPLKVDSIVVHSPLVKAVLQKVFSGFPDLVIDLDELIFDAPFAPFFHRWDDFSKAVKEEQDPRTKSHLQLLYDALDSELQKPIQRHNDLVRSKAIDFELLWTLFTPGTLMYSHDEGHDRLYETSDCEYWQDLSGMKFTVRCDMIDWDGEKFGKVTLSENISKFRGTRKITTLPSYPLKFHAKAEEIKKKCIERGTRFQELSGVNCKDYKGTAIEFTKYSVQTVRSKRALEGRIMLDEELFAKFNPDEVQYVRDLEDDPKDTQKAEKEASDRLAEQSKKAIQALIKAEAEIKKKEEEEEEEAKKKAEEETKKTDSEKKDAEKKGTSDDKKSESEDSKASASSKSSEGEKNAQIDTLTQPESAKSESKEGSGVPTPSTTDEKPNPQSTSLTEKSEEFASSESTDSDGAPTPATEDEDEDKDEEPKDFSQTEKQELKGDQLAICNSWLRGYSLTHQKWCSFSVSHVTDVTWNEDAFSELTLPDDYRELILATIKSQIRQNQWKQKLEQSEKEQKPISLLFKDETNEEGTEEDPAQFDDFIASKGLGYIMLFSGNPGVGKTATAECIAELLHVPLCIISVGNLGTSAESVESALQDVLELAAKWNAVLLLDEADIFLEARTKHDIHRNAVVSVFLRLLEYYAGCLILTTNRSEEIDPAFHSRIHISLPFADLTETNREQIWRHFAKHTEKRHEANAAKRKAMTQKQEAVAPSSVEANDEPSEIGTKTTAESAPVTDRHHDKLIELSSSDFRKLSQTPLNGRQIKNAFKTAVLLASYKKEKVQMKHVKTALKTIDGNGLGKREVGRMYY